jgi:outer membrane protein OmpA-like peptidoglycan-associated protein
MHRTIDRGVRSAVLLSLVAMVGCSEDLGPITATWSQLQSTMTAKAAELRKQYNDLAAAVKAMPAVAPTDASGQGLVARLRASLAGQDKLLGGLDGTITSAAASVQEAIKTGKVASIQKAIDDAKSAYDGAVSKIGASATSATALLSQLKTHNAQLAAEATRANTAGSRVDFTEIVFKPASAEFLFDGVNTQVNLDKVLAFVNSCSDLAVAITGHTSNDSTPAANMALSVNRAKAVQKWLLGKGVSPKKIRAVSGKGATENVVAEPDPKSTVAKAMPAAALEELRRKNRRITLVVVTPCPAK